MGLLCGALTGGVDCWGDNTYGELGNGTIGGPDGELNGDGGYDTPQVVSGITNAVSVISSGRSGDVCSAPAPVRCSQTAGWTAGGTIPRLGQLGNGTTGGPDGVTTATTRPRWLVASPMLFLWGPTPVTVVARATVRCSQTAGWTAGDTNEIGELGNGTIGGPDGADGYDTPLGGAGFLTRSSTRQTRQRYPVSGVRNSQS